MKTYITLLITLLISTVCFAQIVKESEVPGPVITSFKTNFKDIQKVEWGKEKDKYEAEFTVNNIETSATFNPDGTLLETETEIKKSELPASVVSYISKNYPGYKISGASMIIDVAGATKYEAEIKKMGKELDLIFDSEGNFLSKETDNE